MLKFGLRGILRRGDQHSVLPDVPIACGSGTRVYNSITEMDWLRGYHWRFLGEDENPFSQMKLESTHGTVAA